MEKKELSIAEDCIESVIKILTKMQKEGKDFSSAFYEMIDSFFNLFLISNLAKYGFNYKAAYIEDLLPEQLVISEQLEGGEQ